MIALLVLLGLLIVAAVVAVGLVVAFIVAVVKYRNGTLTKEELEKNSKKVQESFRGKYDNWRKSPTWYDRTFGYR